MHHIVRNLRNLSKFINIKIYYQKFVENQKLVFTSLLRDEEGFSSVGETINETKLMEITMKFIESMKTIFL
jgi:hypothetical protein